MKRVGAIVLVMTAASAAASQPCGTVFIDNTVSSQERVVVLKYSRAEAYRALRTLALAVQAKDGGELTAAHKAMIQAKLTQLNDGFSREFCNLKALDANGRAIDH